MLEEFIKWMAQLPELERDQKMEVLMNLFAPSTSHEDFKRLKGALKRKENRIKQLEAEKKKAMKKNFDEYIKTICQHPDYPEIKSRIVAVHLYRNVVNWNNELSRQNQELQNEVKRLTCELNRAKEEQ